MPLFTHKESLHMGFAHQIESWSDKHNPKWLVVLRAGLGFCLFIKGIQFIQNSILLDQIFADSTFLSRFEWLSTFIPILHLLGGALIIAGLFTRFFCLLHIPILLGAIFLINIQEGFFSGGTDLFFSIIILALLCFFLVEGGGYFSLDHSFRSTTNKRPDYI
jgi:putative oxidoreductase